MTILSADYTNLDYEMMAKEIGLKPKHIPMLIASFLEESQPIISSLKTAIESNDYNTIGLHAHSIKGSAGNLRLNEVYEMSREMELAAKADDSSFSYAAYLDAIMVAIATIKL